MRRVIVAVLLIVLIAPSAQAETYRITGKATFADSTPVTLDYVYVQCIPGDFACYQYRGAQSITDAYGYYSIVIDVTEDEDEMDILLNLRGENFTHTIDIQAHRDSSNNQMVQDIRLEQNPPPSGVFLGFGCFIVLFTLVFVSVLLRTGRRLSTREGRMQFMGMKQARMLECPTCKQMVAQHEFVMHLIVDHDMEAFEAGELSGRVMRRTWSEEE
ncbi:MAG: hypothetical protein H2065_03905 [Candidatus Poseidoniales archaeon]|nr:hypothetical protein [Candidatus Poseidoniales archaeon]